jgi:hypothetical protein
MGKRIEAVKAQSADLAVLMAQSPARALDP